MDRRVLVVILLIMCLSGFSWAEKVEVWALGFSNEMVEVANNLAAKEFTPKTGIDVKFVPLAWGDGNKVFLALISNDAPEIISSGLGGIVELGLRGSILDLRETFGKEFDELEAQFFPAITEPLHWMGTRFGVPQNVSLMNAAYRIDILSDMGVDIPELWDDVYKILPKLKAQKRDMGFFYGSPNYDSIWGAYTLITQHGGNFFHKDGFTSAMDNPESIRGFTEYIELFTKHKMPTSGPGLTAFKSGEWAMMIDGYWMYTNIMYGAPELQGKWAPGLIPGTKRPDGTINHGTFSGATTFAIPKTTKNPQAAWEFLKWFCSAPVQKQYTDEVVTKIPGFLQVPTARDALYNLSGMPEDIVKTLHAQLDQSIAVPYAPTANVLYRFVDFAIQACVQQGNNPEAEARKAASEMNKEMARRKIEYKRFLDKLAKENKL
ncbi:MAG TPA: extracellular solute-binding protein [Firmicutes bacterium]|jgi:ABC-type glycerol-3-phosphate transport system substrate-binding protein|nr:extracellular solute-binding protein [Bacillota bacterium]